MHARFELRHLRYFVAVAEELSFRRAAERLHISAPPLSRQIQELETILGASLFKRTNNSIRLTPAGEAMYKCAIKLLAEAEAVALEMASAAPQSLSMLRIAVSIGVPISQRKLLEAAWKNAMEVDVLEIEYGESRQLLQLVRQKQYDFALVGSPGDFNGLECSVIQTLPLSVTIASNHSAARKPMVSLHDLGKMPLFWFPRSYNPSYFDHCAKVFKEVGYQPDYCYVAADDLRAYERISQCDGFVLMTTAQLAAKRKGVVHRPLKEGKLLGISLLAAWIGDSGNKVKAEQAKRFVAAAKKVLGAR